jgi:hypothetical protein
MSLTVVDPKTDRHGRFFIDDYARANYGQPYKRVRRAHGADAVGRVPDEGFARGNGGAATRGAGKAGVEVSAAPIMAWRNRSADELDMLVAEIARLIEAEIKRVLIQRGRLRIACEMTKTVREVAIERSRNLVMGASPLTEYSEVWNVADQVLAKAEHPLYGNVPRFLRGRLTDRIVALLMRGAQ